MKAIPMRGRLVGKRITGFLWAGPGRTWRKKENYFQLEHNKLVTAVLVGRAGSFWIRCDGTSCEIKLRGHHDEVLGTAVLALPYARK